jgi:tetratricopeptide (TPR) repeat protein
VYYYTVADSKRAIGCLEKARKLRPDFEDALVL